MSNPLFTDAQLDVIHQIVHEHLAPAPVNEAGAAPESAYVSVVFHFRDGPIVSFRVTPAVREQIGRDWCDDNTASGVYAHRRYDGTDTGESGLLCISFDEVLFID